ncbi:MSP domain-containing protein [Aphelenchoides besseyi]|nr:MSP domain-containing protein [Aphelenchoides besseyi]
MGQIFRAKAVYRWLSGSGEGNSWDRICPFTEVVTTQLTLSNPTDEIVYFKVKTTAPRYYCVRPNSGIINGHGSAKISVMLQPVDQPATLEKDRTRHKFMIQSAVAANESIPVEEFWKSVNPSDVMDTKLKVSWIVLCFISPFQVVFTNLSSNDNNSVDSNTNGHNESMTRYSDNSTQPVQQAPPPYKEHQQSTQQQPVQRRTVEQQRSAQPTKADNRSASGDRDRNTLTEENFSLVQQVQELRHKLNAATRNATVQTTGISLIQVILAAVAALLIGVIVGKLL